jgi:hypothetical protein
MRDLDNGDDEQAANHRQQQEITTKTRDQRNRRTWEYHYENEILSQAQRPTASNTRHSKISKCDCKQGHRMSRTANIKESKDPNGQGAARNAAEVYSAGRAEQSHKTSKDTIAETSENRKKGHSKQTYQPNDMQNIKCHQNSMQNRSKSNVQSTYEKTQTSCIRGKTRQQQPSGRLAESLLFESDAASSTQYFLFFLPVYKDTVTWTAIEMHSSFSN